MRITANTFSNSLVDQLATLTQRQYRLQNQASTGQLFTNPDEAPEAMQQVMNLQQEGNAVGQYRNNVANLREWSQANYSVMQSLKKISDRVGELATSADGTKSPDEMKAYAAEVNQLIQQAVQAAQSKYNGGYLLGGTLNDQPPFTTQTDANGNVVSVAYNGNQGAPEVELAEGVTLTVQVVGANSTGAGAPGLITDSRTGADFFNHMIALRDHMLAGDSASIVNSDIPNLGKDEENLVLQMGSTGAVQARLDASETLLAQRADSLQKQISDKSNADLAQTLVRLNQTQTAYQAALQSGAKLLNQSLLNYLQ